MVQAHHVWLYRITESFMFGTEFTDRLDPTTCIWGRWRYSDAIHDIDDPVIMELIRGVDKFRVLNKLVQSVNEPLMQIKHNVYLMSQGNFSLLEATYKEQV